MQLHRLFPGAALPAACWLGPLMAAAQVSSEDPSILKNRLTVGARFGFGITAEVQNRAPVAPTGTIYEDGFVLPDVNGGAGGQTWNWGYNAASQVNPPFLDFHQTAGSPHTGSASTLDGDPQGGFEVLYGRELKRWVKPGRGPIVLGLEGGFGSLDLQLQAVNSLGGPVNRRTDRYGLGTMTPPPAPYTGAYAAPGPLLPLTPGTSLNDVVNAQAELDTRLRSLVLGFKLGPFLELPIYQKLSARVSAGGAFMAALSELESTETLIDGAGGGLLTTRVERQDGEEWVFGFYGQAALEYAFTDYFRFYLGGQYQYLDSVSLTSSRQTAVLSLDGGYELITGLRLSF